MNATPLVPLTSEQLRARHSTGNRNAGLVEDSEMRKLERLLDASHREAGEADVASPVDRPIFGSDTVTQKVTWKSQLFGAITIGLESFAMGNPVKLDRFTMVVPVTFSGQPEAVSFTLSAELAPGVRLLHAQNGPAKDCTIGEIPKFSIPVTWIQGAERNMPQTVDKIGDDIDVVFLDTVGAGDSRKGAFVQLNVSLCTRRGNFYLVIQQAYAGQVVRTTLANAEKTGLQKLQAVLQTVDVDDHICSVVPLFPENAYPGSDFFRSFGYLASDLVKLAVNCGASVPLSKCTVARWEPEAKTLPSGMEESWSLGTVMWFGPGCLGQGFLYTDGQPCFIHFKQIMDVKGQPLWLRGGCPGLTAMTNVAVRYNDEKPSERYPKGRRKATAVRVL